MPAALLDVNMLVALGWYEHTFHAVAQSWFRAHWRKGWATTPMTQSAFVRIVSNRSALRNAVTPAEAVGLLEDNLQHATHEFWPDDLRLADATRPFRRYITGHQQIPDAYLLGLVLHHKSRLVTFDKGAVALAAAAGFPNLVSIVGN
jgi:toxin-antitoxin system PIN domain toxin